MYTVTRVSDEGQEIVALTPIERLAEDILIALRNCFLEQVFCLYGPTPMDTPVQPSAGGA